MFYNLISVPGLIRWQQDRPEEHYLQPVTSEDLAALKELSRIAPTWIETRIVLTVVDGHEAGLLILDDIERWKVVRPYLIARRNGQI